METTVTEISGEPSVTVLSISGAVDAGQEGLGRLHRVLDGLIADGVINLVVDLSEAEFLVSRALGQLLTTAVRVRSRGGDLVIAGARGPVAAAALAVGVGAMVSFHETVDEAAQALVESSH